MYNQAVRLSTPFRWYLLAAVQIPLLSRLLLVDQLRKAELRQWL